MYIYMYLLFYLFTFEIIYFMYELMSLFWLNKDLCIVLYCCVLLITASLHVIHLYEMSKLTVSYIHLLRWAWGAGALYISTHPKSSLRYPSLSILSSLLSFHFFLFSFLMILLCFLPMLNFLCLIFSLLPLLLNHAHSN